MKLPDRLQALRGALAHVPKRAAVAAAIISLTAWAIWGFAVPLARWQISIPITIDHEAEATLPYPSLETAGILAAYRMAAAPLLKAEEEKTGGRWSIAYLSSPTTGLSLSLTAPFDSSVTYRADLLVASLASVLESTRTDLFASIGLRLAHETELLEADRTPALADPLSDESQLGKLDDMSQNLSLAAETLQNDLRVIESQMKRLKSPARTNPPSTTGPKKASKARAQPRVRSGQTDSPKTVPPAVDMAAYRRLKSEAARIREEIDLIAQSKREIDKRRRALAAARAGLQKKQAELAQVLEQNRVLTRLFEAGYGKLDVSRRANAFPSRILDAWFAAQPLGLLVGPVAVWLFLRRRREQGEDSILSDRSPVLGTIPALPPETVEDMLRPLCFAATAPREALALTKIATDLAGRAEEHGCRTIAFVGSHRGCGTSITAALLTAALTNEQQHPLLIDLHWMRPVQHRLWWIPWASGTVNWLTSQAVPAPISSGKPDHGATAPVVPAGPLPPWPEKAMESAPWPAWIAQFPAQPKACLFADLGNVEESQELMGRLVSAFDGFILVSRLETAATAEKAAVSLASSGKPCLGFLYAEGETVAR